MTPPRALAAEGRRRIRLSWLVCVRSVRYLARNLGDVGWRDLLVLPVVTAVFLLLALFAPDLLSEHSLGETTPHAPVTVE